MLNQSTIVWTGPAGQDQLLDFLSFFGAAVILEADCFVGLDDEKARLDLVETLAQRRGRYLSPEQCKLQDWSSLLPSGQHATFRAAQEACNEGTRCGISGALTADLSQSVERLRTGAWMQTLTRGAIMCSVSKNHLFTASEIDFCMGWPTVAHESNDIYANKLGIHAQCAAVGRSGRQSLAGNGMMLPQFMSFFLYAASHCVRRAELEALHMQLCVATADEHDEDDDGDEL